jgi:hypothetical protein
MAGNGQHRLTIAFGIVKAIEKVNAAGARGSDAYSHPARVFRVATGGERRGFLVPNLYELQLVSMGPKSFKHSVYTISGKAEDYFYSPIDEPLYDHVCYCHHTLLKILRTPDFAAFVRAVPARKAQISDGLQMQVVAQQHERMPERCKWNNELGGLVLAQNVFLHDLNRRLSRLPPDLRTEFTRFVLGCCAASSAFCRGRSINSCAPCISDRRVSSPEAGAKKEGNAKTKRKPRRHLIEVSAGPPI